MLKQIEVSTKVVATLDDMSPQKTCANPQRALTPERTPEAIPWLVSQALQTQSI